MTTTTDVLNHLEKVKGPDGQGRFTALCPFHQDTDPSLRIFKSGAARCFGSCDRHWSPREFAEALGFAAPPAAVPQPQRTYDYRDVDGSMAFQVVRRPGKKFIQRRPDTSKPGEWVYNVRGVDPLLYRLPQLMEADSSRWLFVVEGEKDADNLGHLGLVATTNPRGAGKWREEYSQYLTGRLVAVIPDNDDAGQNHAETVARSVHGMAAGVKVVALPGLEPRGDVSDWLEAGGTAEALLAIVDATDPYIPMSENGAAPPEDLAQTVVWEGSKWRPVARRIIQQGLLSHGYFLDAEGRYYYFDQETKVLYDLISGSSWEILVVTRVCNATEQLSVHKPE